MPKIKLFDGDTEYTYIYIYIYIYNWCFRRRCCKG